MLFADGTLYFELEAMDGVEDIQNFDFIIRLKRADGTDESFDIKAVKNATALASKFSVSDHLDFSANLESLSLWMAQLFAFLGGIILNLMPCVFPILSLKALGLIEMAKKSPAQARMSGNIYTLGVLTCFAGIAAIMLGLRYAGEVAGWGFHMQIPLVNLTLGLVMVAVALNLLGVFEIGSHLGGAGQALTKGGSYKESFFTGFLAVIVATPCSAPLMAPALGYGSFAPAINSFLVFIFLGFGLAFPYLLLSYHSGFRKIMPRPGNWMISMRKILSFPMFLTALWLFWILGKQSSVDGMALAVLAAVMMSFAIFSGVRKGVFWKITAVISYIALGYFTYSIYALRSNDAAVVTGNDILVSEDFTTEKMVKYVEEERPLFIYFTADWCVTCKVNEAGVLGTEKVAKLLKKHQVTVLKGDMTNDNPEVVKILRKFGRIGVPLYVFYPKGAKLSDPIILPQILSYSVMAELFEG
jgi:thiol:disulfide interchange protein DsbD